MLHTLGCLTLYNMEEFAPRAPFTLVDGGAVSTRTRSSLLISNQRLDAEVRRLVAERRAILARIAELEAGIRALGTGEHVATYDLREDLMMLLPEYKP